MSSIGLYNSFSTEIEISLIHLIVKMKNTMTSYVPAPSPTSGSVSGEAETIRIEAEVHILVTARDKRYTNFQIAFAHSQTSNNTPPSLFCLHPSDEVFMN